MLAIPCSLVRGTLPEDGVLEQQHTLAPRSCMWAFVKGCRLRRRSSPESLPTTYGVQAPVPTPLVDP